MRQVAEETNAGIVWRDERRLVDLHDADDIVLISRRGYRGGVPRGPGPQKILKKIRWHPC